MIPTIDMQEVISSNIHSLGHDMTSDTLAVRFRNNTTYHYANVSYPTFDAILTAPSVGKEFIARIKSNPTQHPYTKQS